MKLSIRTNRIIIIDGANVSKREFKPLIEKWRRQYGDKYEVFARGDFSMMMEWATHCMAYKLGYKREQSIDVCLDYPCDKPEALYIILGILSWIFIR